MEKPKIIRRASTLPRPERASQHIEVEVEEYEQAQPIKPRRRSWRTRALIFLAKTTTVGTLCVIAGRAAEYGWNEVVMKAEEARAAVLDKMTVTKIVHEVKEVDEATLDEIIVKVAQEKRVDPIVLRVLAKKESNDGRALYRFEPALFQKFRPKFPKLSDDEVRMLASSHGPFHVLGSTAKEECDLHWAKLYEPVTSARCAASIVSRLNKEASGKRPGERLWSVFKGFNGSGPAAEAYADHAMRLVAERLYEKVAG